MLDPKTCSEKIIDMVSDDRKYGIGVSVDQRESFFVNRSYFGILLNVSEIRDLQNLQYNVCRLHQHRIPPVLHNLALMITVWSIKGADPKTRPIELSGRGTVVLRQQPDDTWLMVLENP